MRRVEPELPLWEAGAADKRSSLKEERGPILWRPCGGAQLLLLPQ